MKELHEDLALMENPMISIKTGWSRNRIKFYVWLKNIMMKRRQRWYRFRMKHHKFFKSPVAVGIQCLGFKAHLLYIKLFVSKRVVNEWEQYLEMQVSNPGQLVKTLDNARRI